MNMDAGNPSNLSESSDPKAANGFRDSLPSDSPQQQQPPRKLRKINCIEPTQRVQRETGHVSCLPPEVLVRVFRFLQMRDRLRVAGVCTAWKDVVYQKTFWSDVTIELDRLPADANEKNRLLDSLLLRGVAKLRTRNHTVLREMTKRLPNLRRVTMTEYRISRISWSRKLVRQMTNLTQLYWNGAHYSTDSSVQLLAAHLKKLTILALADCEFLTNRSLHHIAMGLPELKHLTLACCHKFSDEGVGYLSGFELSHPPAKLPQLQSLYLECCSECTDLSVHHLSRGQPSIQKLRLRGLNLSDAVFQWLAIFKQLHHLVISDAQVTGSGMVELAKARSPIAHLQFDTCTRLTQEALEHVSRLKQLRTLTMVRCSLSEAGLEQLVKSGDSPITHLSIHDCGRYTGNCIRLLSQLKRLQQLGLRVGDRGAVHLAYRQSPVVMVHCADNVTNMGLRHLAWLPNLWFLDLSKCKRINGDGLKEFVASVRGPLSELHLCSDSSYCEGLGADTLSCVARGLPALTSLRLSGSHVDEEGMEAAARLLPRLHSLYVNNENVIEEVRKRYDGHFFQSLVD